MTFRIIQFEAHHMNDVLTSNPSIGSTIEWRNPTNELNYEKYYSLDTSFSFVDNGHIVATYGLKKMWDHVWHIWFYGTDKVHKHPQKILRFIDKSLPIIAKQKSIKRIHTQVHADWDRAIKSLKFLQFAEDGFFENYGPDGSNYYNYRRLF